MCGECGKRIFPGDEIFCRPCLARLERDRDRSRRNLRLSREEQIRAALVFCKLNDGPAEFSSCLNPQKWAGFALTAAKERRIYSTDAEQEMFTRRRTDRPIIKTRGRDAV